MEALVAFALGVARVDLEDGEWELVEAEPPTVEREELGLPLVVATARHGPRVIALVARRPPLVISDDAGATWRELGSGLPPGVALAVSAHHPDELLYASAERLFVSRDGGRFWQALTVELPEITAVELV